MAGIGFELKKLFINRSIMSKARAYFYSVFVTIGPVIIGALAVSSTFALLEIGGISKSDLDLLQTSIIYSFIASILITSGYCMVLSRYVSDRLYFNRKEDILPTLYGSITIITIVCAIIGFFFYLNSPLPLSYKVLCYLLFIELVIMTILTIYISAVQNYKKIAFSFLYAAIAAIIIGFLLIKLRIFPITIVIMLSFDICIMIIIIMLISEVQNYYNQKSTYYFDFIRYFAEQKVLFLINTLYMGGLYVHSFIFWRLPSINVIISDTYIYAPSYDIPAFYALYSIFPTLVIFIVRFETSFFEKYKNYFYLVNNNACYEDMQLAKKEMQKILTKELLYIMEIQLFVTIGTIIYGLKVLPYFGFTYEMVNLFNIMALGYYCVIIMYVIMTILLYFNSQIKALSIVLVFFTSNFILTFISTFLESSFYGLGFFLSGLISLVFAIIMLVNYYKNLEYYIFCTQVALQPKKPSFISKYTDRLNKIGG
ncbi:MAG: exopolysaccharide Pel transporter PelG [Clostridiales bacterium]|nr:exopolysaccharide Pel transporter PelG [Clostridiales bacterium]